VSDVGVGDFLDSVADDSASDYTATINWGDGSTTDLPGPGGEIAGKSNTFGPWAVRGTHTYSEEGGYLITVTVTDTASAASTSWELPVTVADAGLSLPAGPPAQVSGAGSSAVGAMQSFEAAIGGSDNGSTAGGQNSGYRHITWDDVALSGGDPGSTTIRPGHVVSVAPSREQARGIELSRGIAVANDGFTSVNPAVSGSFPAVSSPNIFAPFNVNRISMQIVSPATQSSASAGATTRGLGVMFLNVQQPNTTIQYYSGSALLYTATAPVGGAGQRSFVGVLFPSSAVTAVVINMGSAAIFSFDGSTVASGPSDTSSLVAADDVVLAEPVITTTTIQGTAGVPVSGLLGSFSDGDSTTSASDYTAAVAWGDGSQSGAPISGSGGTFSVTGTHTYMRQGTFQATTTVTDFGGSTQVDHVTIQVGPRTSATTVSCSPSRVAVTNPTTCTATVSDVGGGTAITPTGQVGFSSPTGGASFPNDAGCFLHATQTPGRSQCSIMLTPGRRPPTTASAVANYGGDVAHSGSKGEGTVTVRAETCSVKLKSKRLARRAKRLPVVVTCEMPADVRVTVIAVTRGKRLTLAHLKTSVTAHKATTIRALISRSGLRLLRTGPKHRRMSFQLTGVASQRSRPLKIHVTVKGLTVA
jgi:hypothetical protein